MIPRTPEEGLGRLPRGALLSPTDPLWYLQWAPGPNQQAPYGIRATAAWDTTTARRLADARQCGLAAGAVLRAPSELPRSKWLGWHLGWVVYLGSSQGSQHL